MPCVVGPDGSMECVLPPPCGVAGAVGCGGATADTGAACKASECTKDTAGGGGGGGGGDCGGRGGGGGGGGVGCEGGGSRGGGVGPLGLSVRLGSVFATPRLTLGLAGPQCGVCGSYGFGCRCGALALLAGPSPPPPVGVVPDTDTPSTPKTAMTAEAGGGARGKDASYGGGRGGGCALKGTDGSDGLCTDDAPSAAAPLRWVPQLAVAAVSAHRRALAALQRTRGGCHRFSLWDQCVAEAVGTGLIVIFGVGVVCTATLTGSASGLWQVASVWGFGVALAILCTASVSGAHLNPAVSLAFALFRPDDFPWHKLLPYWAAQYTGGVVGGAINLALFGPLFSSLEARQGIVRGEAASVATATAFGQYFPNPGYASYVAAADVSPLRAMAVEAWGAGVMLFVILAIIDSRQKLMGGKEMIPFYIGSTNAVLISLYAPLTQAGWNPARDVRFALVRGGEAGGERVSEEADVGVGGWVDHAIAGCEHKDGDSSRPTWPLWSGDSLQEGASRRCQHAPHRGLPLWRLSLELCH